VLADGAGVVGAGGGEGDGDWAAGEQAPEQRTSTDAIE
jgi:hypothetical protein